ncbi:MAG: FIST C-terminal domain-containing protein [Chloroflexota bacterium]|nr:FIST C-terminal domain-containing protein [Chloroflexota bacterium]
MKHASDDEPGAFTGPGLVDAVTGPRATSALVAHESWAVALEHATDQVMSPGDPAPDLLLLFASPRYGDDFEQLVRAARQRTGTSVLIGCSASGLLANGLEAEDQAGLAIMAWWLPDAHLYPVRLHQEHIELLDDPALWHELNDIPVDGVHSWLMFAEPYRIDAQALIQGLQARYPGASIMGGLASGMVRERTSCVFFDDRVYGEGGVALGIGGPYALDPYVSQGCDPVGEPWTITEADHNALIGISNRPALDVLQATVNGLPPEQRARASKNLVVGLAGDEYRDAYGRGDFVIRGILGIDPKRGSVAIGGVPRLGQTVQFHLRDAGTADADLVRMMHEVDSSGEPGSIVGAVVCTCDGRGEALFGAPNHDSAVIRAALPHVPAAGAFCIGEIGPLGDRTVLHGFTATLGLLRHISDEVFHQPDRGEGVATY